MTNKYPYHKFINDWMRMVEQREVHTSNEMKKLMPLLRKVLNDKNIFFDKQQVESYVGFAEKYYFPLMPDQKCYAALILGLYYKDTRQLVFPSIFILAGRGWGKNGFISTLADFMLTEKHGVNNYDIDIVATSEDQAKTSFDEVYETKEKLPPNGKKLYNYNLTQITYKKTNSTLKYRTSLSKTKDGGRPGCVIFDEIHAYENYENIKVFTGGLGKKPRPRRIYITTDGDLRDGVLDDYKKRAERILNGEIEHNGFLPIIMKLDTIQEVGKFELWEKANPRINYDPTLKAQLKIEYDEMQEIEALKQAFITKRMNIPYIPKDKTVCKWQDLVACCKLPKISFSNMTCHGSIDFADLRDFAVTGLRTKKDGITYYKEHTFIHESSLELTNYNIDIKEAVREGSVTIIKKEQYPTIPPNALANWFKKEAENGVYIEKIKCDSFRYGAVKEEFELQGLPEVVQIRSGTISHNKTAPILEQMLSTHTISLPDTKLFRWYVWNVKREVDKKGNIAYYKIEPIKRKTDGFFCLLHNLIDDDLEEPQEIPFMDVYIYD